MKYSYHMTDEEVVRNAKQSVEQAIAQLKSAGIPVFYCDAETRTIIQENSDGTKINTGYKVKKYHDRKKKGML
ncbi:hypothetical protein DXB08_23985 [Hungatella hathewayi]|jgi:hypothetical protein|uniref:hypothetical protein n=1 Tax=Hungatella hathewayi TaxID=154046 RepID=UPI000E4502D6|nr:hypothetical protein [Hungatella hathewayi]RGO68142.1 hypothetical protein DXB08_23985 [Hungatella hathewayi]